MKQEHSSALESRDAIAIVGMAGRFPGAKNIAEFWNNLRDGVESIRELTPEELRSSGIDSDVLEHPSYVNVGAPLEDADCFDAAFFGYKPREAELMDPQQRLFLECAYAALQDAGYDPAGCDVPVGVFGGVARNTYHLRNAEVYRALMDEGALYEALLGSEKEFTVTRVAFKLNLKGPAVNVQAACSTSGVAIHLACQSLLGGECDMALAGGTRVRVPLNAGYIHVEGGIPSPDGRCRAFDAGANGCVFGSGVGIVVLKRVADAIRDGDQIYAVVLGTAINNDGSDKVGFTAPSVEGQAAVVQEALALADVDADTVDYIEAHGTGTTLGDPIEIAALTKAYRQSTGRNGYCAIGSLKTNIGHLDAGAGVTGLMKTVLALKHKQIPPSLNFKSPNPQIDFAASPFFVNDRLRDWSAEGKPRRAGVSSFGLGGTNFHAILEEAPPLKPSGDSRPWQLLTLSAKSASALVTASSDLAAHLQDNPSQKLGDVAYTLHVGRADFEHRRFTVCRDPADAIKALPQTNGQLTTSKQLGEASVTFMFPGQGAQHVNMARDLYEQESVFREQVDACVQALKPHLNVDLRQLIFPQPADEEAAAEKLKQTAITQPALFVVEYALARLWQSWGIEPQSMIGHSVGEYAAAALAGVFSMEDALKLLAARGRLMQQQSPGSMLAVRLSEDELARFLTDGVSLAACNAPKLCVVSGTTESIEALDQELSGQGIGTRALHTSHAFHSVMMQPALEPFLKEARQVRLNPPEMPFVSTLTGTWITADEAQDPEYWARQFLQPVRFSPGIVELRKDPTRVLLEVGPGKTLCSLAQQHRSTDAKTAVVASLRHPQETDPDVACMLRALGTLWVEGVQVDWSKLYQQQRRRRVSLPTYPFERTRYWLQSKSHASQATTEPAATTDLATQPVGANSLQVVPQPIASAAEHSLPASTPIDRKEVVINEIKKILHDLSGVELDQIDEKSTFLEMGFDSLFLTQANSAFQKKFKTKITFRQLFADAPTPEALAKYVDQQLPPDAFAPPPPAPVAAVAPQYEPAVAPSADAPAQPPLAVVSGGGLVADVIRQQMQIMDRQLNLLGGTAGSRDARTDLEALRSKQNELLQGLTTSADAQRVVPVSPLDDAVATGGQPEGLGPFRPVKKQLSGELSARQQKFLDAFIKRYNRKTKSSKRLAQQNRQQLADPRTVAGFRLHWKECVYPITAKRTSGAYIWDLDGNQFVDVAMGFGVYLFGHSPPFVTKAIRQQLEQGYSIGPQTPLAGEIAGLIREMTGMERTAFCNTGSEAVLAAMRIARTVTGRTKIATFSGDYHGIFDEVLGRSVSVGGQRSVVPVAPGILPDMLENVILLDYGDERSLQVIKQQAHEIAAVIVEPVRTRNPDLQPRDFLHALRDVTAQEDIALVFDEMVTGFRSHPGGAQAWFDVEADVAAYGKVVGGGLPIGIVAGRPEYMDALDGGMWQFGDDSVPEAGVTWFAGTFVRHPLALAASAATLRYLKQRGPALQQELNARTDRFVSKLNEHFASVRAPLRLQHFSSFFLITFTGSEEYSSLLYCCLRDKGVHITENRAAFLSTAHSDKDFAFLTEAFKSSVAELMEAGFLVDPSTTGDGAAAAIIDAHERPSRDLVVTVAQDGTKVVPLTEAQSEIWLAAQFGDEVNCSYNLSFTLALEGELNIELMRTALQKLVDRHESLRTVMGRDGDVQRVQKTLHLEVPLHDLAELPADRRDSNLTDLRSLAVTTPFDLAVGPLARFCLIRLAEREHLVFLTMHHIICDGYSCGILLRDLGELYSALVEGRAPALSESASFSEYAIRQQTDPEAKLAEAYWVDCFRRTPPVLDLPSDRPRPPLKTFNADRIQRALDPAMGPALARVASDQGCTVFALIFSIFTAFLERLTAQDDLVVAIVAAGQARYGERNLVGHFANLLPMRVQVNREKSFLDHLDRTKRRLLDAFDNQACTFGTILRKIRLPRDPSRLPLVSVVFNMDPMLAPPQFAGLDAQAGSNPRRYENFDWFFNLTQGTDGFGLECTYNADLFDSETISDRLCEFESLVASVVGQPDLALGEMPVIPEAERQRMLVEWNRTQREYPSDQCVHQLFEQQTRRTPDKTAVRCEGQSLTYSDLERRANQVAHCLEARGVGPDVLVGICTQRSIEMVVGLLGILKAGGAYVPIDPTFPKDRIAFMLEDSRARVLVTQEALADVLPTDGLDVVCLDSADLGSADLDCGAYAGTNGGAAAPHSEATAENLAYVIFTSGSTGRPKGVQISHRALLNFLHSMQREPGMTSEDILLAVTTLSFDIAGLEIFLPLMVGGSLEIVSSDVAADAIQLMEVVERSGATMMQATPATWRMFIEAGWQGKQNLKILCGGEAMPRDLVGPLVQRCVELWNMYGPTETTIWSSVERITTADGVVSIGRPIDNTQMYILDERLRPVPCGVPGELHIGGDGLARGYLDRPELTAERFVRHPFSGDNAARIYKTGDVARYLSDGRIECLGRWDHQVKVRGFRIELGEIETRLSEFAGLEQAAVVVHEPAPGDQRLAAYFTMGVGHVAPAAAALRSHLSVMLPDYMVPQYFVPLETMPLTPNRKIDRRALPALEHSMHAPPAMSDNETPRPDLVIPDMNRTVANLMRQAEGLEQQYDIMRVGEIPDLEDALNDLCRAHVCRYLVTADPEFCAGAVRDIEAQRRALGCLPTYRRFHEYMLDILEDDGVIQRDNGRMTVLQDPVAMSYTEPLQRRVRAACPGFEGTLELLDHCSRQYREALSGEVPGISVLFVDGQRDFFERLLRKETVEHRNLRVYRDLARQLVVELARTRPVRILEIGGGGGMLTWELAPALKGLDVQYTFTDVGPSIVAGARREAVERGLDFIDFQVLDITRDPTAQGFQTEAYDIILGLNVVHATPDLEESLGQLARLLVPGGLLGLIEYVKSPRWDDLIWGVTEGWWCFEDRYRQNIALTDIDTWEQVLRKQGFVDVQGIPTGTARADSDAALILGSAPAVISAQDTAVRPPRQAAASPRDALELQLCNTWQALLHVKPVGIHDDFFDLGGHSLLAVRLMVQIERAYGKRLPLATLLSARTVAQLADILRADDWEPTWNCLVPMRAGGQKPPFFLMHSHGGNVLEYDPLVEHLGDDQPVYALQARGLDGKINPDPSIQEMAACYVDEIKSLQPEGPYYLGGFCFGGILALEAARQLRDLGDEVAQLVLIQTQAKSYPRYLPKVTALHRAAYRLFKRIDLELDNLSGLRGRATLNYFWQRIRRLADIGRARTAIALEPLLNKCGIKRQKHSMAYILESLAIAHEKALQKYDAPPYDGKVSLFPAKKQRRGIQPDETLGWGSLLSGQVEVCEVPGHQQNMLNEPNVAILAEQIRVRLAASQSAEFQPWKTSSPNSTSVEDPTHHKRELEMV